MDSREILLAIRQVSTEANKKMPKIHFATENHTDDLESCCFSRWIFAVCLTVYSILCEVSAAGVRPGALIALFRMKVVRTNCAVKSLFRAICRVLGRVVQFWEQPEASPRTGPGKQSVVKFDLATQSPSHLNSTFGAILFWSVWLIFRQLLILFHDITKDDSVSEWRGEGRCRHPLSR